MFFFLGDEDDLGGVMLEEVGGDAEAYACCAAGDNIDLGRTVCVSIEHGNIVDARGREYLSIEIWNVLVWVELIAGEKVCHGQILIDQ